VIERLDNHGDNQYKFQAEHSRLIRLTGLLFYYTSKPSFETLKISLIDIQAVTVLSLSRDSLSSWMQ
jgi:hypothetical protein